MSLTKACSKCGSEDLVKKKQRYQCKACDHTFTVSKLGQVKLPEVLRMVLQLYLEGVSFRGIERIWRVSHGMVIQWVRR
jgi:transposase-like protein